MKIELSTVAELLKKNHLDPALLRSLIEELTLAAQPLDTEAKAPAIKKQFAFIISDPDRLLPKTDFAGWIVQLPEVESVTTALERVHRTAYEYNATRRGALLPCRTIGDALENIPAKFFKESELWVKTKTPILVLRTDGPIPGTDNQMDLVPAEVSAAA